MARDCWAKGGAKEGQNPHRKGQGKANTVKVEPEFDAAWLAAAHRPEDNIEFDELDEDLVEWDLDDEYAEMPPLLDVSDSDDEPEEHEEDEEIEEVPFGATSLTSQNLIVAAATSTPEYEVDIYDSGATQHMTPSRHHLTNFKAIEPRGIVAADSKKFEATGMGDMFVEVPNGRNKSTRVLMKDVLYAPNLGATLISIGRITLAGYALQFRQTECRIFDSKNRCIGIIPLVHGLYRVQVPIPTPRAHIADNGPLVVTPDKLHKLMGTYRWTRRRNWLKINWLMESNSMKRHAPQRTLASLVYMAE